MQNEIKVNRNIFQWGDVFIKMNDPIEAHLILLDKIVILTNSEISNNSANIYGYDVSGNLLWQIAEEKPIDIHNYYLSIFIRDGSLVGYNFEGFEHIIDANSGVIKEAKFVK